MAEQESERKPAVTKQGLPATKKQQESKEDLSHVDDSDPDSCDQECLSDHEIISYAEFKKLPRAEKEKRNCYNKCHCMQEKQEKELAKLKEGSLEYNLLRYDFQMKNLGKKVQKVNKKWTKTADKVNGKENDEASKEKKT